MSQVEDKNQRDSRFEMLRIIAMLLIIGHHYCIHGLLQVTSPNAYEIWKTGTIGHKITGLIFYPGGEVGVALFFMITGYFLINKTSIGYKRTICATLFYSWVSIIIFVVFKFIKIPLNIGSSSEIVYLWKSLLVPVSGGEIWFVTFYIALLLISPVINKVLCTFNNKQYLIFLAIFWLFWYSIASMGSTLYGLQKAVFFYAVGAYIRLFYKKKRAITYACSGGAVLTWTFGIAIAYQIICADIYGNKIFTKLFETAFTAIIVPICSVCIFLICINASTWHNTIVNYIGRTTFGIYLMHDAVVFRNVLWQDILKVPGMQYDSPYFAILMIGSMFCVFAVFSTVDMVRILLIEDRMLQQYDTLMRRFKEIKG